MTKKPDCPGNIDPARTDVGQKPKRRRKPLTRKVQPMPEVAKPWVKKARQRKERRPIAPPIMFDPVAEGGRWIFDPVCPVDDEDGWLNHVADAFGTRSMSVINSFFEHLSGLCQDSFDHTHQAWKPNERQLNAAIAIIHATRPKDELGAMLCAQAVAIHWMQMRASGYLLGGSSGWLDPKSAATCANLAKTFVVQVEAIDRRHKKARPSRQIITVKRENHYHEHKHVHLAGGAAPGVPQPQTSKGIPDVAKSIEGAGLATERPALPGPHPSGEVVPLRRCEGQAGLPDARRGKRIGSAKG